MEDRNDVLGMLDLMLRPGFCVKQGQILRVNQAAQSLCIRPGTDVASLLRTGQEAYRDFHQGALYLTLTLAGQEMGASVSRVGDVDVFVVEQCGDDQELKAMALVAQELRSPLSGVMATAQRLFPLSSLQEDSATREQVARLNRGLYQMLRVLGNMSDAAREPEENQQETRELGSFFDEMFDKARGVLAHTGLTLEYQGLKGPVYGLVCAEQLERAVLNMLSNALKFTPKGGTIRVSLVRKGHFLHLHIQDTGCGLDTDTRRTVFSRYLRQPAIEDSRFGLGLGMVLVRSAAASHGGVVLIDQPESSGTRVTFTIDLSRKPDPNLHSRVLTVDYAGNLDHWLVELADSLPPEAYTPEELL